MDTLYTDAFDQSRHAGRLLDHETGKFQMVHGCRLNALGLKKALDHIDEIIALIKKSKDTPAAHAALMKEFKFK
jgi:hypothetical protein